MRKMSYKVSPPDLKEAKSYEIFLKELLIWEITTPVPDEKKGAVIAGGLPNDCKLKKDLKDKFFENVDVAKLASKGGLGLVKTFLEEQLGEDELEKQIRTWFEFEDCDRGNKDIEDFVSDFDRAYKKAANASSFSIPSQVRAFMVLKRANINKTQKMLVMSKLDKKDKDTMFDNMCSELKIVLRSGPGTSSDKKSSEAFKLEPADIPSEEVLFSHGYVRKHGSDGYRGGYRGARGGGRGRGRGAHGQGYGGGKVGKRDYESGESKPYKRTNRLGEDGKQSQCHHSAEFIMHGGG